MACIACMACCCCNDDPGPICSQSFAASLLQNELCALLYAEYICFASASIMLHGYNCLMLEMEVELCVQQWYSNIVHFGP